MDSILHFLLDIFLSFFVALGFAMIFETPKKALWVAGMLGGLGHCIRSLLLMYTGVGIVSATLAGSLFIGFAGIFMAHKIHTPPVVFTLPACITMIPGLYAYRTMLGIIQIYEYGKLGTPDVSQILMDTAYNFILTALLLLCLAIGICVAMLIFRKKSVKEIRFGKKMFQHQISTNKAEQQK